MNHFKVIAANHKFVAITWGREIPKLSKSMGVRGWHKPTIMA